MGNCALQNNCEVDLYVEHTPIAEPILVDNSTLLTYNKDGENQNVVSGQGDKIGGAREKTFMRERLNKVMV
ncbi:hypothetical protein SESBI_19542 [Sesbania bispinosa]|nr:hypothetical protein SESBI_19542 [Sesbania bispinosa]